MHQEKSTQASYDIVIAGGGTAGITVASQLAKSFSGSVAIIEPNDEHYYQPLFTLVGAGEMPLSKTIRRTLDYIPKKSLWIKNKIEKFSPETHEVILHDGEKIHYQFLVVALGLECNWYKIKGLDPNFSQPGICSNYATKYVEKTWQEIKNFKGGKAVFTFPNTPVKCAGAPQKIMYLAEDYFQRHGVRHQSEITFFSASDKIFGVTKYREALEKVIQERNIQTKFKHHLEEIVAEKKIAKFRNIEDQSMTEVPYDLLHITPPMSAPQVVKESSLANQAGWVDVDQHTLQHKKFPNVFSLGDVSSLPTSKTGAAIRKQAPVLIQNLLRAKQNKPLEKKYDGYTSCPLVTGYGKLILAEFDYLGNPQETFPFDQGKERRSMYWFKKYFLPIMYWYGMLRGRL